MTWGLPVLALTLTLAGAVYLWYHPPRWPGGSREYPLAVARSRAATGRQRINVEEVKAGRSKSTLRNANIVELTNAGVRPDVIVRLVRSSNADYDLRPDSIIELKNVGVDASVILAMIDQNSKKR